MRFSRIAVVALPILGAAASVLPRNDCNGGTVNCCSQVIQSNLISSWLVEILDSIGLNLGSIGPAIGLNCIAQNCQSNTVCCTGGNHQSGLLSITTGCTPITL